MGFIKELKKPHDCVIGTEFEGHSQKKPTSNCEKVKVELKTNSRCCISKETKENIGKTKTNLKKRHFIPHYSCGDYLVGSSIYVKDVSLVGKPVRQTDPLSKSGHRIHICKLSCEKSFGIGFIESKSHMSPKVALEHSVEITKTIKLLD